MNLKQLQDTFSRDAKYRAQYEKHKDSVKLVMHVLAIRKALGISLIKLASELNLSKYDISKFESLKKVDPRVVSVIVKRFQNELREQGFLVEKWFVAESPLKQIPPNTTMTGDAPGRKTYGLPGSRPSGVVDLPNERNRTKSREEEKK